MKKNLFNQIMFLHFNNFLQNMCTCLHYFEGIWAKKAGFNKKNLLWQGMNICWNDILDYYLVVLLIFIASYNIDRTLPTL